MTIEDRRGAAYHEAGHIVLAWAFGLRVSAAAIGIGGDDSTGETEFDRDKSLPLVDKIAVCAAGAKLNTCLMLQHIAVLVHWTRSRLLN